jgi:hypothetical protein
MKTKRRCYRYDPVAYSKTKQKRLVLVNLCMNGMVLNEALMKNLKDSCENIRKSNLLSMADIALWSITKETDIPTERTFPNHLQIAPKTITKKSARKCGIRINLLLP